MAALVTGVPARAAEARSTLSVIFENDLFYHTDRDYTNGVEVTWTPPEPGAEFLPGALRASLSGILDLGDARASYSLGQMMFTPEHTALAVPPAGERPYAGFLYGALALSNSDAAGQSQLRLQLGMVGPASLAADSQQLIHGVRDIDFPRGWSTQLRDEPGLVLTYQKSRTLGAFAISDGVAMDIRDMLGARPAMFLII
jgi:lipid A 3-O-deacylase